ncbi:hypothetical protein U1Q18_007772 [Sarracenia purpurea var. burkii]
MIRRSWRETMMAYEFDQRPTPMPPTTTTTSSDIAKTINASPRRLTMIKCFSWRSAAVMAVLTVALLVLPLVLPPLPPPPSMLLLVPILIMAVLFLLAFSRSKLPNVAVASL